jgi:hypothetical protein
MHRDLTPQSQFDARLTEHTRTAARAQAIHDHEIVVDQTVKITRMTFVGWGAYYVVWAFWLAKMQNRDSPFYATLSDIDAWDSMAIASSVIGVVVILMALSARTVKHVQVVAGVSALLSMSVLAVMISSSVYSTGVPTYAFHTLGHLAVMIIVKKIEEARNEIG